MTELAMGFSGNSPQLSHLGERAADWLRGEGFTARLLVVRTRMDKRDAQRVLDGSCGPRAFDSLAKAFGWPFIEAVMTPVIGADPLTALENEIERERAEIAARERRLEQLRAATVAHGATAAGGLRLVSTEDRTWRSSLGHRVGTVGQDATEGDR